MIAAAAVIAAITIIAFATFLNWWYSPVNERKRMVRRQMKKHGVSR